MLLAKKSIQARRGFTLTEAAIVLGIAGLILGAIWVAASSVYESFRVSQTSEQLMQIVQSIRSMHATQSTVDSQLSALLVAKAGGIPSDMLVKDDSGNITGVNDIFGGAITISAATYTSSNDSFSIIFSAVPQSACTNLLVRNTGTGRDTGLVAAGDNSAVNTSFPMTLTSAVGACPEPGVAGNDVLFTFRLKA